MVQTAIQTIAQQILLPLAFAAIILGPAIVAAFVDLDAKAPE